MANPKSPRTTGSSVLPSLEQPLSVPLPAAPASAAPAAAAPAGPYDEALAAGEELRRRPYVAAGPVQIIRQHAKDRMTVWERIEVLRTRAASRACSTRTGARTSTAPRS